MAKVLDTQSRAACAHVAVGVLRTLQFTNSRMTYGDFARAVGLMSDNEQWKAWHQQQVRDVLNLVAAIERKAGRNVGIKPLEYDRPVTAKRGLPGSGVYKISRIVTEKRTAL